jgi:PAS domain-containing protein
MRLRAIKGQGAPRIGAATWGHAVVLSASEQAIAQAALALGPHAVISADLDGIIREWNETAERIFSHNAADAIGRRSTSSFRQTSAPTIGAISGAS